jgi:hypothetical protein
MNNTQTLSPKVSIDEALVFLGMASMEKTMGIKALLRISELDGLPLFFDERLFCVPTFVQYGDQYDDEGEYTKTLEIDPKDVKEFWSEHMLASFKLYKAADNSLNILVNRIIHADTPYHIYQCDFTVSDGVSIAYEKFYFDRDDLIKYKDEYSANYCHNQQEKSSSPKKPPSIIHQRITAFKYWLIGNSGKSIHNAKDLQSSYEKLNEPTKKQVWDKLSLMDSKLFSTGKDDFLKAMSNVITFKQGTSKGRDH